MIWWTNNACALSLLVVQSYCIIMVKRGIQGCGDAFKMVILVHVLGDHVSAQIKFGKSRALVFQGIFCVCKEHLVI